MNSYHKSAEGILKVASQQIDRIFWESERIDLYDKTYLDRIIENLVRARSELAIANYIRDNCIEEKENSYGR